MYGLLAVSGIFIAILVSLVVCLSWRIIAGNRRYSYDLLGKQLPTIVTTIDNGDSSPATVTVPVRQQIEDNDSDKERVAAENSLALFRAAANSEVPTIDFNLVYDGERQALKVKLNRVTNLPVQLRKNCASYVKVILTTGREKIASHRTEVVKKSLNPHFESEMEFQAYPFEQLRAWMVRLSVYVKRKHLAKKLLVGDLWVPLSRPDFEPDTDLHFTERLSLACPNTGKRGPQIMTGKQGFLYVQVQYQPDADRLKVVVRRGQSVLAKQANSAGNSFQIIQPEYYVIISLHEGSEMLSYKETKCSAGESPVWNQPFLFDAPELYRRQYWLQFLVMRGKLHTKDGAVGQVRIGPNTTPAGIKHWIEIIGTNLVDAAKWHEIAFIGTHCF